MAIGVLTVTTSAWGQTATTPAPATGTRTPPSLNAPATTAPAQKVEPLQLRSLDSATQADPFPPADPKRFTADSPSVATVDGYLRAVIGWDANSIWRVEEISKTRVPGISKVVALVSQRGANAKVQTAIFYVLPDGKHLIANAAGPQAFGIHPYAEDRAILQAQANGPARGGAGKDFELVEFADLQCPRCKEAQATMARLAQDFPTAHIVFEDFPVTALHPYSYQAAAYGACIAQANPDAFFVYATAVYDSQATLTPEAAETTLNAAVTKAGLDPDKVSACSKTSLGTAPVDATISLAKQLGVEQTPILFVDGRIVPIVGVPYETLKSLVIYQTQMDGIPGITAVPLSSTPITPVKP